LRGLSASKRNDEFQSGNYAADVLANSFEFPHLGIGRENIALCAATTSVDLSFGPRESTPAIGTFRPNRCAQEDVLLIIKPAPFH
jgi:hypothetical protein